MKNLVALLFAFSTLTSSAHAQSICSGLLSYASRDEIQDDSDVATAQSVYTENCQGSSLKSASRTDVGLDAVIKAIPFKFKLGSGSSHERLTNFCKIASDTDILSEKTHLRKSTVVREALDAFNKCVQLSNSTANFDPVIGTRDVAVSIRRGTGNLQIMGIKYDKKALTCSVSLKTETKTADLETRILVNDDTIVPVTCDRLGVTTNDGDIRYPETELTILTDRALFKIPVPADTSFPPATASSILSQLKILINQQQAQIGNLTNRLDYSVGGSDCETAPLDDRAITSPAWSKAQCGAGTYMRGIEFTHPPGRDGTYQESVRVTCCRIKQK